MKPSQAKISFALAVFLAAPALWACTATATSTRTWTPTPTPTGTYITETPTITYTPTFTRTPTLTPTNLGQVNYLSGGATLNLNADPGSSLVVFDFRLSNSQWRPFNIEAISFNASGTGNEQTGIVSAELWFDRNSDRWVSPGDIYLGSRAFGADNGSVTFMGLPLVTLEDYQQRRFLLVYTFSASASGTFQATLNAGAVQGSVQCAPEALSFTGSYSGHLVTVTSGGNTLTPTNTVTITPTATSTISDCPFNPTSTKTPLACVTVSTSTPSYTPTPIITNTPTYTLTVCPTCPATTTYTPTNSNTNTRTYTPTFTRTFTPTITPTGSITDTFTITPTSTGPTWTPTFTRTFTATPTRTFTPTGTWWTPTLAVTNTPTFTYTLTPTNTIMVSPTSSASTFTPTFTRTFTTTHTPTFTFSNTPTGSSTYTPTNTRTFTPTFTPTWTGTLPTSTFTSTPGSPTPTGTFTLTGSPTFTNTRTFTPTSTNTRTPSPTSTNPITLTSTPTPIGTAVLVTSNVINPAVTSYTSLGDGTTIIIPANSMPQPVTVTVTKYLAASAPSTATAFQVSFMPYAYVIDTGGVEPIPGSSVTITLPYNPADIPGGYTESDLIGTYFDGTSWVTLATTVDTVNNLVVIVTDHFSWWAVARVNHTPMPVPTVAGVKPILYPNPVDGEQVRLALPSMMAAGEVKVQIFTVSYRKIRDVSIPKVQPGTAVTLDLLDKAGAKLSNGLYYLLVHTPNGKAMVKLLVSR